MPERARTIGAARQLHERGLLAMSRGRPREAQRLLKRALGCLAEAEAEEGSALVLTRVLITLGHAEFDLRGIEAAMTRLDAAADLVRSHHLPALEAALHNQRGIFLLRGGRLVEAIAEFDAGAQAGGDDAAGDRCKILLNRAIVHMDLGSIAAARRDLQRCMREAKTAGLPLLELKATHNLGYVEFMAGNLPRALQLMDAAYAMDPSVSPGVALLGKARVLVEAGLAQEADTVLLAASLVFGRQRLAHDLADTELERARCAMVNGDARAARRLAGAARNRFRRLGNERSRRGAELIALQADLAAGRAASRLVGPATRLRAELRADGLRLPARAASLMAAEAYLGAGQIQAADDALVGIGPARRDDPITGRLHSRYVQARVDAARGRTASASRRIRGALGELADYQASFGSIDLRTASAVHGRRLAELDISLALEGGRAASVFAAAERARAMSGRLPAIRPPDDPVAADLLAELRQVIESLRAVEQDRAASEPVLRRRRELERQIVARTWTVSGSGSGVRPAEVAEVRARLAARGPTMVMYVQAAGALWAVVVGERLRLHSLGPVAPVIELVRRVRADLDVLAQSRLAGGLRGAIRSSLHRSLDGLDDALIAPLAPGVGALAIISTGVLGQLPWASLSSLRGVSVVVAPSATKWLASTEPRTALRTDVVAIAGPGLDRAVQEAEAVGAAWPGSSVVTGAVSTRTRFAAAMTSAHVLHVAAHGVHQPENPLFSSLRMSDGPVFAHELDQTALAPEHVVLSACEVGLATVRPGDEALGLASVLLQLGTRSVIAGVARVSDAVAEQTMASYHAKLVSGSDSAAALAQALVEVDSDVTPPFVTLGAAWRS